MQIDNLFRRMFGTILLWFFFFLPTSNVLAEQQVVIDSDKVNLTNFRMSYFIDSSQSMTFDDIKQQNFIPSNNQLSLGTDAQTTWAKIVLNNATSTPKKIYIQNPYAYHNRRIAFYAESQGQLLQSDYIDLDSQQSSPYMYRGTSIHEVQLEPQQTQILYIQIVTYSHQWFELLILDQSHSRYALVSTAIYIALMIGILLALIIYNFMLYFSSNRKENIYYSLYMISAATWISLSYGLIANIFDAYGITVFYLHLSLITMPIFLILFMMSVFETKINYPTEHKCLLFIQLLLVCDLIFGFFDIAGALKPASTLAAIMMLVTISVSISLYRKGNPLAKYFFIGHFFFLVFNLLAVLFYKGLVPFTYVSSHGVGIGIMLEALMLAYIIAYRIKMLEDIKASQEDLKLQAITDPMTGLYNRRYFYTQANTLIKEAKEKQSALSLLVLDIDEFKQVNDNYGHQVGDLVLIKFAEMLKKYSRTNDLVVRFGGEEFVLVLPCCDQQGALIISEKIRKAVELVVIELDEGCKLQFTVSIGITEMINTPSETLDAFVNRADKALYTAKNSGRNQVCIYQAEHDIEAPVLSIE